MPYPGRRDRHRGHEIEQIRRLGHRQALGQGAHAHITNAKAHAVAGQQAGLDAETVDTINAGGLPADNRLRALVRATRRILGKRGWLSDADEQEFDDLGLGRPVLYEIVALVGIKTMSNYVNHTAGTTIDEPFQQ